LLLASAGACALVAVRILHTGSPTSLYLVWNLFLAWVPTVVRRELGVLASWVVVVGASALAGVGIYLGRVLRANSWDVLTNPHLFARLARIRLADPLGNPKLLAVTVLFTFVISVG